MISHNLNSDCNIRLFNLLNSKSKEIIDEATEALTRAPLKHYKASSAKQNRERLTNLLSLYVRGYQKQKPDPDGRVCTTNC